jgi:predicted O-methyltransferase YrrM
MHKKLVVGLAAGILTGIAVSYGWCGQNEITITHADRLQFIREWRHQEMDTTEGDAALLRIMVAATGAKRGVEVGSFRGFGAINMGISFERNGGHLFTLEIDPGIANQCRENLEKVGLQETVTVVTGDALVTLPKLEGEFDFVFLDANKPDYLKYLLAIEPKLKAGALIVADNTIGAANAMKDFLSYLNEGARYDATTLRASMAKNDGMTVAFKLR